MISTGLVGTGVRAECTGGGVAIFATGGSAAIQAVGEGLATGVTASSEKGDAVYGESIFGRGVTGITTGPLWNRRVWHQ